MKKARKFFALFLCLVLFCSAFGLTSYAAKDDDGEDYGVFDVGFDVSNDRIFIYWEIIIYYNNLRLTIDM